MNKRTIIPIAIVAIIIAAIAWRLATNKKKINEKNKPKAQTTVIIPVTTAVVTKQLGTEELMRTGTLIPNREAQITASLPGKITSMGFNLGSYVGQGAVVARLDGRQQQIGLEQARIAQNKAEQDYARTKRLVDGDAAPAVALQDAKAQRDNAIKQVEMLSKQVSDNVVIAPISGQIVEKYKVVGEYVNPGMPIARIVDVSRLKANVMVNETDAYALKIGHKVTVTTDVYPGNTFSGTISFISSAGDATHSYPVEILINNTKSFPLKAGTTVMVNFNNASGNYMMTIPRTALTEGLKTPKVFVVENGKAMLRDIVVGREIGNQVEVLSGLAEGAEVIVGGQINLKNGSAVKVVK